MTPQPFEPTTLATYWTQIDQLERSQAEDAWHWFIGRYRGFVRSVLARFVRERNAEAATDDFWAYLFTSDVLQKADRDRRLRGFLVGVLRNFARDWLRRHRSPGQDIELPPERATFDLHEDEVISLWAASVLHNALDQMHQRWPNSAEVLRMFYGLGDNESSPREALTVSQTADALNCTTNAVHQALHRGRKRLRACLEVELERLVGPEETQDEIRLILGAIGQRSPGLTDG